MGVHMPIELPDTIKQLLTLRAYGHVVTRNQDGSPQMSMVWMDVDGNEVLFNTAEGRVKPRNLRRDPRILISVQNPLNPQGHAIFHGTATVTAEGAEQHIDMLAKRFLGTDKYPWRAPGEKRLIVRTQVDRIAGLGL
ncbi:MAG: PPOX class F420-dependent oxidoreductase [Acidobacteria bacterium]|nr:PPOX class F420-dependent oxidoreductase [Acidobacteriota bacterium]